MLAAPRSRTELLAGLVPLMCLLLSACAGVGIVSSDNPLTKLNDAEVLFVQKDRPLPAERLILEAIGIYQRNDDAHGLGNAYREYADLLRSPAVARHEDIYRRDGFADRSITFDTRLEKANDFYHRALEYYHTAAAQLGQSGRFDALTNLYFNIAWVNIALGQHDQACAAFDQTLQAYNENMRVNPTAKPNFPGQFANLPEALADARRRAHCPP
jgi:tetratricopeptide (TPR) repeat protein